MTATDLLALAASTGKDRFPQGLLPYGPNSKKVDAVLERVRRATGREAAALLHIGKEVTGGRWGTANLTLETDRDRRRGDALEHVGELSSEHDLTWQSIVAGNAVEIASASAPASVDTYASDVVEALVVRHLISGREFQVIAGDWKKVMDEGYVPPDPVRQAYRRAGSCFTYAVGLCVVGLVVASRAAARPRVRLD